jgi:hypothetical protein
VSKKTDIKKERKIRGKKGDKKPNKEGEKTIKR